MKVLAIRAKNLTSIERFELDLSHGPLAETRIFAITGPTGAGKSTLLDAMCLALYDRAPRLAGSRGLPSGRPSTGDLEVSAIDPRSLVRRGAAEASAEVDFEAEGGARWRAIWEVWRARKRADGKIQDQRMRLVALADGKEHTGATKTETLAKIESLIGLGYAEFRRAVLLAQNDFASFLRAKPDERAELLERMTGTEIYAAISRNAHLRAKAEDEVLSRLEADRARISMLAEEARRDLNAELEGVRARRAELEVDIANLAQAIAWREERVRLERERAAASGELEAAIAAQHATAPLAEELAKTIAAEHARPAYEDALRARARNAELAELLERASETSQRAGEQRGEMERALEMRRAEAAFAKQRAQAVAPELDRARALDVEIKEAQRTEEETSAERSRVRAALSNARAAHETLEQEIEREAFALRAAARALAEMSGTEKLAAQWPRWAAEIERYPARLAAPEQTPELLARMLESAQREAEDARAAAAQAKKALDEKRRLDPPRGMFVAAERLNAELGSVARLEELAGETKRAQKERAEEEKRGREAGDAAAALEVELRALEARVAALEIAEKRSALLTGGEPCPLCGSRDHPAAHEPVEDRTALVHAVHSKRQAHARALEGAARAKDRVAQLGVLLERGVAEWLERRKAIEMLWVDSPILGRLGANRAAMLLPFDPAAKTAVKDAKAAAAALGARRQELLQAIAADEAAGGALDQLREAAENADAKPRVLALELRAAEVIEALSGPLSERSAWRAQLAADPRVFREQLEREVSRFEAIRAEQTNLEEKLRARAIERERLAAELKGATDTTQRAEAQHEIARTRLTAIRTQRGELFGGRAAAEVLAELERDIERSERSVHGALAELSLRTEEQLRAEAESRSLAERAEHEAQRAREAEARVDREIETLAIDGLRELDALLSRGRTWIEMSERALASARDAVARKESTLEERTRKLAEHLERGAPIIEVEHIDAPARVRILRQTLEQVIDRGARITQDLESDDRARAESARLAQAIALKKKVVDRWAELSLLIGSADGKKLRTFAQGLTMESLLLQANLHLEELRPRYRLRRIEGSDLELEVVDGDMGDEVRAVSTLSGGESFLVSLALALALSTIAARDVRIRSLFVDEGFGSLDPEAMEIALATLDRLQAEGRTIAIISHVPQIAERIGYRVHVRPIGPGTSEVVVLAG